MYSLARFSKISDFYPRPPRGGRLLMLKPLLSSAAFLSTPSARRATWYLCVLAVCALFLSTPSARRATAPTPEEGWIHQNISIHALREEGDRLNRVRLAFIFDFYPRPPRGGRRPEKSRSSTAVLYFYPRPPRGGRLAGIFGGWGQTGISIHALREEGDWKRNCGNH